MTEDRAPYWTRLQTMVWMIYRETLAVDWVGEKCRTGPGEPGDLLASVGDVFEPVMDEWLAYWTLYKGCREGWITADGRRGTGPWERIPLEDWADLDIAHQSAGQDRKSTRLNSSH